MELTSDDDEEPAERPPLQPSSAGFDPEGFHESEFIDRLVEQEDTEEARRLQRLADQDIILTLQLQGFDDSTPEWETFAAALIEYGYSVIKGWLRTGTIFRMAAAQRQGQGVYGLAKIPKELRLQDHDDAHGLAADVIVTAINKFRTKSLMNSDPAKRWRADGGASLKTYFVGRCLMELPDVYVKWAKQHDHLQLDRYEDEIHDDGDQSLDPAKHALDKVELDTLFEVIDPFIRVMFELHHNGYTYEEIAEMMTDGGQPTTLGQVRTKMSRARQAMKNEVRS